MAYTVIDKPSDYFNTVLYTGNNGAQTVTGVGFQPDWVWIKDRDGTERHCLTDSVRGVLKELRSNENAAESDRSAGNSGVAGVSAFNSVVCSNCFFASSNSFSAFSLAFFSSEN